MRVGRNEIVRSRIEVGKVTPAASGNRYLLTDLTCMLEYYGLATAFSRFNSTKKTCSAAADDYYIRLMHAQSVSPLKITKEKAADILVRCLILSACWYPLRLKSRVGLRRIVKLSRLNDVLLVVVNAVAIDIDADLNLVLLAVAHIAGIESQAVLAAQ